MTIRTVSATLVAAIALFVSTHLHAVPVNVIAPSSAPQGSVFNVDVVIEDALDLYAFQFDLSFDPSVLQAVAVIEGGFLPTGGETFPLLGSIDNTAGVIGGLANTLVGAIPGANGDGVLMSISFRGIAEGTSAFGVSAPLFLDSALGDIEVTSTPASVTITPGVELPIVGTLALVLGGMLGWRLRDVEVKA